MYVGDGKNWSIQNYISSRQCRTGLRTVVENTIVGFSSKDAAPVIDRSGDNNGLYWFLHCVLGHRNEPRKPPRIFYTHVEDRGKFKYKKSRVALTVVGGTYWIFSTTTTSLGTFIGQTINHQGTDWRARAVDGRWQKVEEFLW